MIRDQMLTVELHRIIAKKRNELKAEGTWQIVSSSPELLTDFFLNALRDVQKSS